MLGVTNRGIMQVIIKNKFERKNTKELKKQLDVEDFVTIEICHKNKRIKILPNTHSTQFYIKVKHSRSRRDVDEIILIFIRLRRQNNMNVTISICSYLSIDRFNLLISF